MNSLKINLLIIISAGLLFIPFLGGVHLFDWDEINFAESAREMIVSGNYLDVQINFQPFWEKPPLFIWMQVLTMKLFGINEFAARFPNAICGMVTLLVLFNIGKKYFDSRFGMFWVLAYSCSLLPHLYFKSGIIDPWFNLFIFLGIFYFLEFLNSESVKRKYLSLVLSAFMIGLAILTKGPVALIVYLLVVFVYFIFKQFRAFPSIGQLLVFVGVLTVTGGLWFILQVLNGNLNVIRDFIVYQVRLFSTKDAGHGGFFLYHFVVLLVGVFPASLLALPAFKIKKSVINPRQERFRFIMLIIFWSVLILFTIVKTKIVHYSSLSYFPLTFLAAFFLYESFQKERNRYKWLNILLLFFLLFYSAVLVILPIVGLYHENIINSGLVNDPFVMGNLQAEVNWGILSYIVSVIYLASGIIILTNKKLMIKKYVYLLLLSLAYIVFSIIYVVPRVEKYSQYAAIEFYKKCAAEDCYVETLGFKSYAQLYYGNRQPDTQLAGKSEDWLLQGKIDKKAYFVMKNIHAAEYFKANPSLIRLYEKNGFVFACRLPQSGSK